MAQPGNQEAASNATPGLIDPLTVFVVDDDPQVRESLSLLMESVDLNVQTFASAEAFLEKYNPRQCGCLVLDVRMPGMSGLELQRRLADLDIAMQVIILTAYPETATAVKAMKAGALDFIEKPYSPQVLLDHVHNALEQELRDRSEQARAEELRARFESLTRREHQVLEQLTQGMNSKQIARQLDISSTTVDFHRRNLLEKMQVENFIELGRLIEAHQRSPLGD